MKLPIPTHYTPDLVHHAVLGLRSLFKEGYAYKKAGVVMSGLVSAEYRQLNLFEPLPDFSKEEAHMAVVDRLGSDTEVVVAKTPSCIGFCSFLFK